MWYFFAYFGNVKKCIGCFIFILFCCLDGRGIWEPLIGMSHTDQENLFNFEVVSFEKVPYRLQYKGFFTKIDGETGYLFLVDGGSLVTLNMRENRPEGFSLLSVSELKNEVVIYDTFEGKEYVLKLGEITYKKDQFQCIIRNVEDNQLYTFSDKSLRCLDDQKSLTLNYHENGLVLLVQRKGEIPLAFRFVFAP